MGRSLLIGLVVLVVLVSVVQGTDMQKKTTIPGLLFPSATPTMTHTPTNTSTPTVSNTPTITKSATITQTRTPNPKMVQCALLISDFFALRETVQPMLDSAFDSQNMKTTAVILTRTNVYLHSRISMS